MICGGNYTPTCIKCGEECFAITNKLCLECQKKYVLINSCKPSVWLSKFKFIRRILKEWKDIKMIEIKYLTK